MDDSFVKAPISVPKLSGFDKSHQNLLTTKVGTITPILFDELIPGSKVNCKLALSASLPPLASETFMRCSVKCEAFFVPMRLLCGSFESWFTDKPKRFGTKDGRGNAPGSSAPLSYSDYKGALPSLTSTQGAFTASILQYFAPGSLADYLGFRASENPAGAFLGTHSISLMPFLAYHKVYSDWFRNSLIQNEVFVPFAGSPSVDVSQVSVAPYAFFDYDGDHFGAIVNSLDGLILADGVNVLSLRQRNFGLDYFTTATPSPQQGDAQVVSIDTSGDVGSFSIASLRAMNSLQQFKERNNLLGNLYVEQLNGRYGVRPSDGIAQRSLYLGRGEFEVYSKGIYQSNPSTDNDSSSNNPFKSVGARYGSAYASGDAFIIDGFEAKEPGYLFVMATLVPRVTYSTGIDRLLTHYCKPGSLSEMANPILQNVGPQPIHRWEIAPGTSDAAFGFTDRYAEFKTKQDSLHGLLRDGQSLQSFALQRGYIQSLDPNIPAEISTAFLEIPTNYLDQVSAVAGDISNYGCWMDCYFDYKVAMPLQKYSLPSLQDPAYEHGKTVVVAKGGNKL